MKSKNNTNFLLILGILLSIQFAFVNLFPGTLFKSTNQLENISRTYLKSSEIWNLTGTPIFIDDSNPNYYWSKIAIVNDWCSGSGTWGDPYIIENVIIDGQELNSCIEIKKSVVHFIIRNCTLSNAGNDINNHDSNIKLIETKNGKLINNTCTDNIRHGIYLNNCENITISSNRFFNDWDGLYIIDCININVSVNNFYYPGWDPDEIPSLYGIIFYNVNDSYIVNNIIYNQDEYGIFLSGNNNTISKNKLTNCGLSLSGDITDLSSHLIDTSNNVNGKPLYYYVNEIKLESNNFNNAGQIILINCNSSTISNVDTSFSSRGIALYYSNNNTISNSISSNNADHGITISKSDNNTIVNNSVQTGYQGIAIWSSKFNTINNNIIAGNTYQGIELHGSNNNLFVGNEIINTPQYGLHIWSGNNNLIFDNRFIGNGEHAVDSGFNNYWNNSKIGNYWDNYGGSDIDDDGIGDTPYITVELIDYLPIWNDGHEGYQIIIDDTVQNQDWERTSKYFWCSGSGTKTDPFIISDLTINGQNSSSCIEIRNSNVYFIIENCTTYNGGYSNFEAGIKLQLVNNGLLRDNAASYNNNYGIYLSDCGNISITSANTVNNNKFGGIYLSNSNNNTISGNSVNNDNNFGISLSNSSNNLILGNIANDNDLYGIRLEASNKNFVSFNTAINNNQSGIFISNSNYNIVSENIANENTYSGFLIDNSNNTEITQNDMSNNDWYGMHIFQSHNTFVLYNNQSINYNQIGIYIQNSDFNIIRWNSINNNSEYGISLLESDSNFITNNTLIGNQEAIFEESSFNNTIKYNDISEKTAGSFPIEFLITIIMVVILLVVGSFVIVKYKLIFKKTIKDGDREQRKIEKDQKKINKEKAKKLVNLQRKIVEIDALIDKDELKTALKYLTEIEKTALTYELNEILELIEERIRECKKLEIETINTIKQTILNLGEKFTRLQLLDIIEKSSIEDEGLIEEVIEKMITNKEIKGEYFKASKALALEKISPSISSARKVKALNIFLSYSTLDSDHFQLSRIVRRLELYPEINEVLYWEVDSKENIVKFMEETLKKTNVFVLFCTENSSRSNAVEDEWQAAFQLRKEGLMKILPVYEEESYIPYLLKPMLNVKFLIEDLNGFIQKLYEEILR